MTDGSPVDVIARGAELDAAATRVFFCGLIALSIVALGIALLVDPCTAVLGALLTLIVAGAAYLLAARGAQWFGDCGVCIARIGVGVFYVVTVAQLAAWSAAQPKPLGCLLRPAAPCIADVDASAAFADAKPDKAGQLLRRYLYPADKSGVRNAARAHDLDDALVRLGHPLLSYVVLLNDPGQAKLRADLVTLLHVDEILWREKTYG